MLRNASLAEWTAIALVTAMTLVPLVPYAM